MDTLSKLGTTQGHPEIDEACLEKPAINANNIVVHSLGNGMRLTLFESINGVQLGAFRGAYLIPWDVAHALKEIIEKSIGASKGTN
jgi:hypothetical protein